MHLSRWQTRFCLRHGQRNQVAFKSHTRVKTHHWAEKQNKTEMHQEPISCLIKTLQPGMSLGWGLGTGSKSPKLRVFSLSFRNKNASLTVGKLPPSLQTLSSLHHTEGASEVGTAVSPFFREGNWGPERWGSFPRPYLPQGSSQEAGQGFLAQNYGPRELPKVLIFDLHWSITALLIGIHIWLISKVIRTSQQ